MTSRLLLTNALFVNRTVLTSATGVVCGKTALFVSARPVRPVRAILSIAVYCMCIIYLNRFYAKPTITSMYDLSGIPKCLYKFMYNTYYRYFY